MATNSHTEAPGGEHKGAFPPFNSQTYASQVVWLAITFVVLYVMLSKVALPRIGAIIENRQNRIDDDITEAGKLKLQSDEAIAAYEKALADARSRAQAIANETRERQAAEAEKTRKQIEGELNAKLTDAEKSIAATKTAAMANVRGIAADATKAIVERLIGLAPTDAAIDAAITDALKG